jgi:hypothetical protein
MAASRSTHKGVYSSDILGVDYQKRVDDHLFTQTAALGWAAAAGTEPPFSPAIRPRHAVGKDASGRTHSVIVAVVTADLWTGAGTTWNVLDDAGGLTAVTRTGLVGEAVTF